MTVRITPADVGKRVSVQYFEQDGSRNEAVGLLERLERTPLGPVLFVRRRDDSLVEVPLRRIRFGKVVASKRR